MVECVWVPKVARSYPPATQRHAWREAKAGLTSENSRWLQAVVRLTLGREELGDAPDRVDHVVIGVEHHDHTGAQRSPGSTGVLQRERHVQRIGSHEAARRTTQHYRTEFPSVG